MIKTAKIVSILLSCVAISACGGAPSNSDIKTAFNNQIKADTKAMPQFTSMYKVEIKDVKKIGCKENGEKAYVCDVELFVSNNGVENKGIKSMRFVKSSDGWSLSQ